VEADDNNDAKIRINGGAGRGWFQLHADATSIGELNQQIQF
jgi:hypothetical protein